MSRFYDLKYWFAMVTAAIGGAGIFCVIESFRDHPSYIQGGIVLLVIALFMSRTTVRARR
jgi:hypothetical protein